MNKRIIVHNSMQTNYTYILTEPVGKNFDPQFKPDLTPKQMIDLGVFGGHYETINNKEFPQEWFDKNTMNYPKKDPQRNYFKVNASQPLKVWQDNGWIHEQDPQGWFLWYCRYFMGRRSTDDLRQIKRWKSIKRHIAQLKKHCKRSDFTCRPKQRQTLLHWAYDSRLI